MADILENPVDLIDDAYEQEIQVEQEPIEVVAYRSYNQLDDKPQINGVELVGNKTSSDLGITAQINSAVNSEAQTRQQADSALQGEIDAEELARQQADSTLQGKIDAEETARKAADKDIQDVLDGETLARQNADTALGGRIDTEIHDRQVADIGLQGQIDAITSKSDVVDVVATYAALQAYDTQHLGDNDVIKVLDDETHGDALTYYRWSKTNQTWSYIGQEAPYYSKSQTDTLLLSKQDKIDSTHKLSADLVDDTNTTNKFVTAADKTNWDAKQDALTAGTGINIENGVVSTPAVVPEVVAELPTTGSEGKMYLVPKNYTRHSASGNPIIASISEPAGKIEEIEINGDTSQDTFQGLNIFNINAIYPVGRVVTLNGVTVTFEQDGIVEFNGAHTAANIELTGSLDAYKLPIDQNKEYYIRIDFLDGEWYGTGTPSFSYECRYNNGASVYYRGTDLNRSGVIAKIDTSGGTEYLTRLRVYTNYGGGDRTIYRKLKFRVAIYETADPGFYEPYVGLAKSPSPLYPQAANSVTGEQTVRITNKNILHELMSGEYTEVDSGSTWRFDNGTIYMSRTEGSWQGGCINICNGDTQRWAGNASGYDTPIANKPGKYTVSIKRTGEVGTVTGYTPNLGVYAYVYKDGHSVTPMALANVALTEEASTAITLNEGDILGSLVLYSQYSVLDNIKLEVQVEHGEEATEFELPSWTDYKINLGKNLFDKTTAPVLNAYLGQAAGVLVEAQNYRTTYMVCEPNTVYTVSKTGTSPLRVAYTNTANPQFGDAIIAYQRDDSSSPQSLTIYTGPEAHTLLITYKEQGHPDSEGNLDSVQVERGTKATAYASYVTPIELHSKAGYHDRISKVGSNWVLHKEVGHIVRDAQISAISGTSSGTNTASSNGAFHIYKADWGSDYDSTISNAFISEDIGVYAEQTVSSNADANSMTDGTFCHRSGTNDRVYFRNTALIGKTGIEVKEIMKQENGGVNFWYPLQPAVDTVITDQALIAQLDAVENALLINGTNIIADLPTGQNLDSNMSLSYYEFNPTNRYDEFIWLDLNNNYEQIGE